MLPNITSNLIIQENVNQVLSGLEYQKNSSDNYVLISTFCHFANIFLRYESEDHSFKSPYCNKKIMDVINSENDNSMTLIEKSLFLMINKFDFLNEIFVDEFNSSTFFKKSRKIICAEFNLLPFNQTIEVIKSKEDFRLAFKEHISHHPESESLSCLSAVIDIIFDDENPYSNGNLESFLSVTSSKNSEEFDISSYWFFKLPRVRDCSNIGFIDMIYHNIINCSDVFESFLKKQLPKNLSI